MTIKKGLLIGALLAPLFCNASVFSENTMNVMTPSELDMNLFSRHGSSVWMVEMPSEGYSGEGQYIASIVSLGRVDGGTLSERSNRRDIDLSSRLSLSSGEKVVFTGGVVGPNNGSWVTFDVENCDGGSCEKLRSYRVYVSQYFDLSNSFGVDSVALQEKSECKVSSPILYSSDDAIYRVIGCGVIQKLDYRFDTVNVFGLEGQSSSLWEHNSVEFEVYAPNTDYSKWAALSLSSSSNELTITQFNPELEGSKVVSSIAYGDVVPETCVISVSDNVEVACVKEAGDVLSAVLWTVGDDGLVAQPKEIPLNEAATGATLLVFDNHLYSFEQLDGEVVISNRDFSGDIYSQRTKANTTITGYPNLLTNDYLFQVNELVDKYNNNRYSILLFDALSTDLPPVFQSGVITGVYSSEDYLSDVSVFDEETLQKDLKITMAGNPDWLELSENGFELKGSPTHSDAGVYSFSIIAEDNLGQVRSLEPQVEVYLMPYNIKFFEATLFENVGLVESYPFASFVEQVESINVQEDVPFSAQYTIENRSELGLLFSNLPEWLSYDSSSGLLFGTPTQNDVGLNEPVTMNYTDPYDVDSQLVTITFAFNVVEVDEKFEVTSNGDSHINVGDAYTYTITLTDEETAINNFTFIVGAIPSWMTFDEETATFTGVANEPGEYVVQLVIRDNGGHTVVHRVNVTVSGKQSESGGSLSFIYILALFPVSVIRRRNRR